MLFVQSAHELSVRHSCLFLHPDLADAFQIMTTFRTWFCLAWNFCIHACSYDACMRARTCPCQQRPDCFAKAAMHGESRCMGNLEFIFRLFVKQHSSIAYKSVARDQVVMHAFPHSIFASRYRHIDTRCTLIQIICVGYMFLCRHNVCVCSVLCACWTYTHAHKNAYMHTMIRVVLNSIGCDCKDGGPVVGQAPVWFKDNTGS